MDESHFSKSIICFSVLSILSLATLMNIEVQNAILPKFISASYKDDLTLQFNSIFLKSLFNLMKIFFEKPSVVTLLVGDLPIYDKRKKENKWHKYNYESEQVLIKKIINKNNYTKIPMLNNNNYYLFPNHNKTKMNVISFSLEEKNNKDNNNNDDEEINICFTKLSTISLYEIPIDNFIINFQDEYKLESAFFKLKWKLNIPGLIIKYVFSSDYEYLSVVYKIVYNGIEVKYKIVYIKINQDENEGKIEYNTIDVEGNMKIMGLAVTENLIVYSRKIDKYKFNFLYKNKTGEWVPFSKNKIKFEEEPYNIISDLKFINHNKNNDSNTKDEIFLFVKGIYCDISGIKMFMKLININLKNIFENNIFRKDSYEMDIFKDSKDILNLFVDPHYFEGEDYNIYENNYTYNINNLELDKLNSRFKKLNHPLIFNKYVHKGENSNFLLLQFLSNITYSILYMNNSYFSNNSYTEFNTEEYIRKKNNNQITKICGNEYFVVEFKTNILSFFTSEQNDSYNSDDNIFFENPRRISFISLPKNFKFTKIYDYYFDKFNGKLILMLLIDDGVIVSLDFTESIYRKNVGATFYRDKFDFKKTTLLFINCFFIFLYFLDWSLVDKISIDIKNFISDNFYRIFSYFWGVYYVQNNNNNIRRENNWLHLSNSNISLISNNSYEESNNEDEINNGSNNSIPIIRRNRRNNNINERNIFEDVFESIPCI